MDVETGERGEPKIHVGTDHPARHHRCIVAVQLYELLDQIPTLDDDAPKSGNWLNRTECSEVRVAPPASQFAEDRRFLIRPLLLVRLATVLHPKCGRHEIW